MKKYTVPLLMLAIFETIAVSLWLSKSNIFYLFNFSYIGISLTLGLILFTQHKPYARNLVQLLVGGYMLIYLGIICGENMQIEGFWYYSKQQRSTMQWLRSSVLCCLAVAGAAMPVGRRWCWICFRIRFRSSHAEKT